ncbi:hypothetical protein KAFR_0D02840 [Kazachstania africana CBS 2517]|uniref:RING-type domain-containing protein n=1 Tax=Kazachstania africana (strain ATCC 22294 / BCRC 22015 / CBS 2517 / CECT 1963 / NBRC 1671 / NRRL Y-8276) TaxID=1071382 RepID=H2AU82_KAZAF|nr:hypothetical protein KAFR_0D02840 [Kazachstania africana CBS 2517]CCF57932.1 hypothetical protein KAFR_0D02840 [Kazachstania africana CBS 2517]
MDAIRNAVIQRRSYSLPVQEVFASDGPIWVKLLKLPVKIISSILNFIDTTISMSTPNIDTLLTSLNYFFSSYALICMISSFINNRFAVMTSLRTTSTNVKLPKWSFVTLHMLALIPLCYCAWGMLNYSKASFYSNLIILSWSRIIEIFISVTSNSGVLLDTDYTALELSLEYYKIDVLKLIYENNVVLLFNSLLAVANRITIHTLELFGVTHIRLMVNTIINICYMTVCFKYRNLLLLESISSLLPNIIYIFIISSSLILNAIRWSIDVLRRNAYKRRFTASVDLSLLKLNGTEELSSALFKIASLLSSKDTEQYNMILEEKLKAAGNSNISVKSNRKSEMNEISFRNSYLISGYLNKLETLPDDLNALDNNESDIKNKEASLRAPRVSMKLSSSLKLLKLFVQNLWRNEAFKGNRSNKNDINELVRILRGSKDLNFYITANNYHHFLYNRGDKKSNDDLLPETDTSLDYFPSLDASDDEFELETDYDSNEETMDSENSENFKTEDINPAENEPLDLLRGLLDDKNYLNDESNIGWIISTISMLKSLPDDKILTRTKYSRLHEDEILSEITMEQLLSNPMQDDHPILPDTSEDEEINYSCIICRQNTRNIILWPCRCMTICDECRVKLGHRGIHSCVSCKNEIYGYSKVHIV